MQCNLKWRRRCWQKKQSKAKQTCNLKQTPNKEAAAAAAAAVTVRFTK